MKMLAPIFAVVLASFTSPPWGLYPSGRNYWRAQQVNSGLVERAWVVYQSTSTVPAIKPFAFDHKNLATSKSWTSAIVTNFMRADVLPAFTNWTPATILADCTLPTNYWTETPFAGLSTASNGWGGMTAILARLTVTAAPGGCSTNCARTADTGQITNGWNNATLGSVCTNYGAWTWTSNDNCALPSAASMVTDTRDIQTQTRMEWWTRGAAVDCDEELLFNRTLVVDCNGSWCGYDIDGVLISCVNQSPAQLAGFSTNIPPDDLSSATNGQRWFSCYEFDVGNNYLDLFVLVPGSNVVCSGAESLCLSRSSNPIGYAIPTTNTACARVEYLAAGLPVGCGASAFQTETISEGLSNGAWVVWSSNAAAVSPYYCNEDFITSAAPFGSCTTNAGWAVSGAKLVLHWDFDYR